MEKITSKVSTTQLATFPIIAIALAMFISNQSEVIVSPDDIMNAWGLAVIIATAAIKAYSRYKEGDITILGIRK